MHGLINRAVQSFLTLSFGEQAWKDILQSARLVDELGEHGFEAMRTYDDALTDHVMDAAASVLDRDRSSLLEDLGAFLVCNKNFDAIRRLLRFGGVSFTDFLFSLEDLNGRAQLAVENLELPELTIEEVQAGQYVLRCEHSSDGFKCVLVGLLRALADDYGALAVLDRSGRGSKGGDDVIVIELHDPAFHEGRHFELAQEAV